MWGMFPLFWKQLKNFASVDVVTIRIVITLITAFIIAKLSRISLNIKLSKSQKVKVVTATLLIGLNWFIYVYAINAGKVLEGSLGYFMGPGVSFLLGVFYLGEKLNFMQKFAFSLFAISIGLLAFQSASFPWIAIGLALTFAFYGLIKKQLAIAPQISLFYETLILAPPCLAYLFFFSSVGDYNFHSSDLFFLALSGLVTYLPLHFFAKAASGLKLSALGTMQYLAPLGQFLLGYFIYREPLSETSLFAYSLVWLGVIIFTTSSMISIPKLRAQRI
jgi:chloramphenicol-sensitive protein RarD